MRKPTIWVQTRSDTNWPLGFTVTEKLKKKVCTILAAKAKALISCAVTDLRLCFRPCKVLVFSCGGSYDYESKFSWREFKYTTPTKRSGAQPLVETENR